MVPVDMKLVARYIHATHFVSVTLLPVWHFATFISLRLLKSKASEVELRRRGGTTRGRSASR